MDVDTETSASSKDCSCQVYFVHAQSKDALAGGRTIVVFVDDIRGHHQSGSHFIVIYSGKISCV
jgi:hypothetical protein